MTATYTASTDGGVTTWSGLQVSAASDLSDVREYASLGETERRWKIAQEQVAFLSSLLTIHGEGAVELRWLWEPAERELKLFLLTRVVAPTEGQSIELSNGLIARLRSLPRHVFLDDLTRDDLLHALSPFDIHDAGSAEIRKRIITATPQRPDAGVHYYLAIQPFAGTTRSWEPVLRALIQYPNPICLSIGLQPTSVPPSLQPAVSSAASAYRRLASPGEFKTGQIYGGQVTLAPDAFAIEAADIFADASRRYRDQAFRIRVSCFSSHPLDEGVLALVGSTISRDEREDSSSYLNSQSLGAAYTVARPSPSERETFSYNVRSLDFLNWGDGGTDRADPVPEALKPLKWIVDAEEASCAFRLPTAPHGTLPGFPVKSLAPSVGVSFVASGPSIELGTQQAAVSGNAESLHVAVEDLTMHTLILGTTGSGKTNTTLNLVRQLWADHRVPFMVLEPVNAELDDYRWLATLPEFEEMMIFTPGNDEVSPLRLNPFEVPPGVRIGTHAANLRACFDAAFGLWDPLPIIYQRALRRTYEEAGFNLDTVAGLDEEWPTLANFVAAMTVETEDLDYAGEIRSNIIAASRLRAESLLEGPCASTLAAASSFPIDLLMKRPVVVELAAVGEDPKEQSLIMALLLSTMTEHYKTQRESSALQHVTVVEEAHRLLGKPPSQTGDSKEGNAQALAAERFANTLAENRKYGEGLVIVEQDPAKLIPDAYKNTNLKIMHRLPSEDDRVLIGDTMRFSEDQRAYASALPPMTAFTFHSRLDRPALVVVEDIRRSAAENLGVSRAPMATNAELAVRAQAFARSDSRVEEALRPQASCGFCSVRCWLEPAAARAAIDSVSWLQERVGAYPADDEARFAWWRTVLDDLAEQTDSGRPSRIERDDHWAAACFIAGMRSAYSTGWEKWHDHLRRYVHARLVDGPEARA